MSLTAESTRFLTPWRATEDRPLNATEEELNHWRAAAERAAAVLKQDVVANSEKLQTITATGTVISMIWCECVLQIRKRRPC